MPGPHLCPEVSAAVYIRLAEDVLTPQSVQETCLSQVQFKAWLSLNTKALWSPAKSCSDPTKSLA